MFGKPLEIAYEIKGAGHGVGSVAINGSNVQFDRESNPYRIGAARIPTQEIRRLLSNKHNVMKVAVGS